MDKSFAIKFYQDSRGQCPVKEFIDSLTKDEQAAIFRKFDLHAERGINLPYPHTRHIEGKLWELRVKRLRFFYCVTREREIVYLHAVVKTQNKLYRRDIAIARRRMNELI